MEINQVYDKQQKPNTNSQIDQTKPSIPKSLDNFLVGYIGNSMNGGHDKTIAYKQVMAGERHKQYNIALNIQMLTPLTPAYQNLKYRLRAFFVPNSRVWENAEKFTAQKGTTTGERIEEIPNTAGQFIPVLYSQQDDEELSISNTHQWRDSWISSYIPRLYNQGKGNGQNSINTEMPKMSILPIRGRVAIYNDFLRNKEYDEERQEYKGDTVTETEWLSYMPYENTFFRDIDYMTGRTRRDNSYYTDYRTEMQGFELDKPISQYGEELLDWASWESKIAEARTQAENAQKNDWEIISEIRGSKKLTEGKVQLLGEKTFSLNYSSITQSSYNTASVTGDEKFKVMGQQGAYSYTNIDIPLYAGVEFIEEGYIHIIATVTADTVYETGIERTLLNVGALDQYRPDMLDDKLDVLYRKEMGMPTYENAIVGYKRKYSELFKLPNCISGDMTTAPWWKYGNEQGLLDNRMPDYIEQTNSTYQFFETYARLLIDGFGNEIEKKIWKDYTDFLINKNQAIPNKILSCPNDSDTLEYIIGGQNQIFFVGVHSCICDLPVDDSIKKNYTVYGEH